MLIQKETLKRSLLLFLLSVLVCTLAYAALEDYTTYTETDEDGECSITANNIHCNFVTRDDSNYTVKDHGVDNFGNFEIDYDYRTDATGGAATYGGGVALSNGTVHTVGQFSSDSVGVASSQRDLGSEVFRLWEFSGSNIDDSADTAVGTRYYLTFKRTASTIQLLIYTDDARTSLFETLSVTHVGTKYRYASGHHSWENGGTGNSHSWNVWDMEIVQSDDTSVERRVVMVQ